MGKKHAYTYEGVNVINNSPTYMEALNHFFNEYAEAIDDIAPFGPIAFTYGNTKYVMYVDAGCMTMGIDCIGTVPDWNNLKEALDVSVGAACEELGDDEYWDRDYELEMNERYGLA